MLHQIWIMAYTLFELAVQTGIHSDTSLAHCSNSSIVSKKAWIALLYISALKRLEICLWKYSDSTCSQSRLLGVAVPDNLCFQVSWYSRYTVLLHQSIIHSTIVAARV